jgi:hypothetical protein
MIDLPSRRTPYSLSSAKAQSNHVRVVLAELVLTLLIAAIALSFAAAPSSPALPVGFSTVLMLFVLGVILRLYEASAQLDRRWYAYRAVAESIKTLSWRYSTGAGEFPLGDPEAERGLRERLSEVESHSRFQAYPETLSKDVDASIPSSMTQLRAKPWSQRREIYLRERVDDQIRWYQSKAQKNDRRNKTLSSAGVGLQVTGILLAIALLAERAEATLGIEFVAFVAVLVSSLIAWSQARQYSELVEPYQNARIELDNLKAEIGVSSSESQFLELVTQTELAISREHTSWLAKRGVR